MKYVIDEGKDSVVLKIEEEMLNSQNSEDRTGYFQIYYKTLSL